MGYSVDRATAREMIAAMKYAPPLEQTAYAFTAEEQQRQARKAAKKSRLASDTASISSFSSTVGLLKSKLSTRKYRAGSDKKKSSDSQQAVKQVHRAQVNISV